MMFRLRLLVRPSSHQTHTGTNINYLLEQFGLAVRGDALIRTGAHAEANAMGLLHPKEVCMLMRESFSIFVCAGSNSHVCVLCVDPSLSLPLTARSGRPDNQPLTVYRCHWPQQLPPPPTALTLWAAASSGLPIPTAPRWLWPTMLRRKGHRCVRCMRIDMYRPHTQALLQLKPQPMHYPTHRTQTHNSPSSSPAS